MGRKGGDKGRQLSDKLISGESQGHSRPGYNDTLILVTRHNDGDNTRAAHLIVCSNEAQ